MVQLSTTSPEMLEEISGLLTSVGKTSREALKSKEPTKIVEKLSVNSRCNSIYKKRKYNPQKVISTPFVLVVKPIKNNK